MHVSGNTAVDVAQLEEAARQHFDSGRQLAEQGDWRGALHRFQCCTYELPHDHPWFPFCLSCEGLAMVHVKATGGLDLCRRAAMMPDAGPDVFENLARAELASRHRRAALDAIREGLALDATHGPSLSAPTPNPARFCLNASVIC